MPSPLDAAVASGATIGRYFSIVTVLPSAIFVTGIQALLAGGAWTGSFEPARVGHSLGGAGLAGAARLAVFTLLIALCVHPFQFAATQLLEGYWGTGRIGGRLAESSVLRHRTRLLNLQEEAAAQRRIWITRAYRSWPGEVRRQYRGPAHRADREDLAYLSLEYARGDRFIRHYLNEQAAVIARAAYPPDVRRVLPTRLGNALRRHEDMAGRQYGLDVIAVAPHLSLLAVPEHYALVTDQRQVLDLAVNLCAAFAGLTAVAAVMLADDGGWCFAAVLPLGLAYLSYRGAVSAAGAYGSAAATVTDLSRFALYDAMHLPKPLSSKHELEVGETLVRQVRGEPVDVPYELRAPAAPPND